ncbi:MAG: hypothetical protein ACYCPS_01050 [Candidatus Saccharimonadales bacterium]
MVNIIQPLGNQTKALSLRKKYFVPAKVGSNLGFCMDDRQSNAGIYLSVAGGIVCFLNILNILEETNTPGSVTRRNMINDTKKLCQALMAQGIKFGIHSDDTNEQNNIFSPDSTNKNIGCGFVSRLPDIQQSIYLNKHRVIQDARDLMPQLFDDPKMLEFARQSIDAGARLSDSNYYRHTPRQIASTAVKYGAPSMIVEGHHDVRSIGIINEVKDTTLDTSSANKNGLPAYDHDSWVVNQTLQKVPSIFHHDKVEMAIVDLITTIGTMRFLGVKEIYCRL